MRRQNVLAGRASETIDLDCRIIELNRYKLGDGVPSLTNPVKFLRT